MEVYAEEHSNLSNEMERCKMNHKADKVQEELLRIEKDAGETDI